MKVLTFKFLQDQLESIRDLVKEDKQTTEHLEQNWDKDREDFAEFKNELGHMRLDLNNVIDTINKLQKQIQNQVAEAIEPARQESADLKEVIIDKKVVAIDAQKTKEQINPWWKVWKIR